MTALELYNKLTERVPAELSCSWDGDGFEVCPNPYADVKKVLIALDVTNQVIDCAIDGGFDVIVAHHPLIFRGIDEVSTLVPNGERVVKLIKNNISVMTFHTRLDAVEGGVNDVLAAVLGLQNVEVAEGTEGIMRVGELECEVDALNFARKVKAALEAPAVSLSRAGGKVKRVALVGGSGGEDIKAAAASGADTFVTGELKYHDLICAEDFGVNLIVAGHFYTEYPVCSKLKDMICEIDPLVECELYFSDRVEVL